MLVKNNYTTDFLYSFDIFDTLITRKTATPQGIFAMMQEILLRDNKYLDIPLYIRENFYDYRMKSEYYQYSYNNCVNNYQDCSFEEIYNNFKDNFNLSEKQIQDLMFLELQMELENLVPIEKNISYLKKLVSMNKRVILISDMYHSENIIRKILTNIDPIFANIKIYVSNEYQKKKRDGSLYELVQTFENVEFSNWEHIGDNTVSDFESALEKGIKAKIFNYPELTSYEQYAVNRTPMNASLHKSIGIAKLSRLNSDNENFKLGSSLAAPILFPYVSWMLNESLKRNYKRLYFIARDGYILKFIADVIIKHFNLTIETKYIYGSRLAWQKPSFAVSLDNLKPVILQYGFNADFLSKILDIPKEKIEVFAKDFYINDKTILHPEQKLELYNNLIKNKDFIDLINSNTKESCDCLIKYLKQEVDFSDDNFAFVDLSGSGVTQNCLASVINTFYPKAINSFYFRNGQYKVQPFNVNRHIYVLRNDACALLELLSRAPHGQTSGYQVVNNKIEPILEQNDVEEWDFKSYIEGILSYVKNFIYFNNWNYYNATIPTYYLDWLGKRIDKKTSELLGSVKFSHVGKDEKKEVAPQISRRDALKYLLGFSDLNSDLYNLSYSRSRTSVKKILEFKENHPNLRKTLFHIQFARKRKEFYIMFLGIKISLRSLIWGKERETK